MAQSQINWKRGDYVSLGRTVANFNKKIQELQTEENKLKLPEVKTYNEVKNKIHTRQELKRVLNSMRRFLREGAEDVYTLPTGQEVTKWEHNENVINTRVATRYINAQIRKLEMPIDKGDYSRAEMGSIELRQWTATLHSIRKLELKQGYEYNRTKLRLEDLSKADYEFIKSIIFRENFMKALESAENMEGYDLLMKKLNRYKNPVSFYKLIKKSNVFMDIFLYYKEGSGIVYGGFNSEQERFNEGLEELGIVDEQKAKLMKKYDRKGNQELKRKASYITDTNDLLEFLKKYEKRK